MSDSIISGSGLSPSRRNMMHSFVGGGAAGGQGSLTGSHPFLNRLNPLGGRSYRGYEQARDDVVEEEDEEEDDDDDRGEGPSRGWMQASERIRMHGVTSPSSRGVGGGETDDEDDGEVPQSFMIEARQPRSKSARAVQPSSTSPAKGKQPYGRRSGFTGAGGLKHANVNMPPRPSDLQSAADFGLPLPNTASVGGGTTLQDDRWERRGLNEHERALWNWVNVYNLDAFLQEVYAYYTGKGVYCIALSRGLNLLTIGFVIGFSTFLLGCVNYSIIPQSTHLHDVIVPHCVSQFSGFTFIFFLSFGAFYLWNIFTFVIGIKRLLDMHRFYTYLLEIPDADIPTISWQEVVRRIGKIRESNPVTALTSAHASDSITAPLDAHDIANRIMRQENYLIALFNKEVLDLKAPIIPLPLQRLLGAQNVDAEGKGRTLTKALEWNLRFCLLGFLFDQDGRVRKSFVTQKNRATLIEALRRRFIFMGCLNAIFAPFIVLYLIMYSFFRYFEEYHKNPSSIGGRQYTPYAQWKFREFNELPHHFTRRLHESYPAASEYIEQFPNEKLALIMKFVSFIAGSFAAVLALASVVDPDLFLGFEITPHRTVVFYLTVFGAVLATARGMIPDDHRVYDTEDLIQEVVRNTHYMPNEWKDKLHSQAVHQEFGRLFEMKIMIFWTELLSVLLTPFILWMALPPCSAAIVDFFREFSVHVDGLGYVCSFAVFDFKRHGNVNFGAPSEAVDERFTSKEGKMEKSFLSFKAVNPDWNPTDPSGSVYLSRLADIAPYQPPSRRQTRFGSLLASDMRRSAIGRYSQGPPPISAFATSSAIVPPPQPAGGTYSQEQRNAERARMYDSALQKSMATRRSAVSDGAGNSARPILTSNASQVHQQSDHEDANLDDDDIRSDAEDSYIDGATRRATGSGLDIGTAADRDEAEELANGGVVGLLTQIYDQRRQVM